MRVSNTNLHFQVDTVHIFRCYVSFWGVYGLERGGFFKQSSRNLGDFVGEDVLFLVA